MPWSFSIPFSFIWIIILPILNIYEEKQYPLRVYESGIWVNTIKYTEQIKLCEVQVDEHGCCCDSEENINNVCNSCGIIDTCNDGCSGSSDDEHPD